MTGPVRFVLSGSGHIAGVINPPDKEKYHYSASTRNHLPDDPDQWLKTTISRTGSWWLDWAEWIDQYSTETVDPRRPGDGDLDVIEDAPGSFVKVRI